MKKMLTKKLLIISLLVFSQAAFAVSAPPKNTSTSYYKATYPVVAKTAYVAAPTQAPAPIPHTDFSQCVKTYPLSTENLVYMCLTALSLNNYQIKEIQFRTGTILFSANSKEFILTTARKDMKNSFVKILPSDNNYNFSPIVINKIYNYIDLNYGLGVQNII